MPRKPKETPLESIFQLASLLPWWAGVLLAILSYVLCHWWASMPPPQIKTVDQAGSAAVGMVLRALAMGGKYILPFLFLAGAGVSAWNRAQRKALVSSVAASDSPRALNEMSWQEFEALVSEAFRLDGFRVAERGGAGADGGVDLVLFRENEKFLVQCKQWKAQQVSVNVVRELFGVMTAENAVGGFVVTSGRFTSDAVAFAEGRNIILVDGPILHEMIARAKPVPVANARNPALAGVFATRVACPECGSAMTKRVAKRGANAGGEFWGCTRYPACKGTRPT